MTMTHSVTFPCPRCGDSVETDVHVSGRHWQSREVIVDESRCDGCGHTGPDLQQRAQDQFDADADAFDRYGRDG